MFQNCLNEFGENDKDLKTILENMKFLSENMPSHSFMFINDLRLYTQVNRIIDSIITIINDLNKTNFDDYNEQAFLINKSMEETFKSSIAISDNVTKYLLTGANNLIPRKIINYNYLSVYKIFRKESKLFEQSIDNKYIDLLEQFNRLQTKFNSFDVKLEQLLAVESNYLKISEIVESYDQKLEEFQTTLQKQKDTIQADLETFKSHLQNLETKNSKQKIKLEEIERRLNRFQEERKNLTRQLERNRKAVIFAILIGLLGVILGVIALFR
jgi:DNA repair ATPase RecN